MRNIVLSTSAPTPQRLIIICTPFRMRGYHGNSKLTSFYSWNPKKLAMQGDTLFDPAGGFSQEYPIGWYVESAFRRIGCILLNLHILFHRVSIDGDSIVKHDNENGSTSDISKQEPNHSPEQKQLDPHVQVDVQSKSAENKQESQNMPSHSAPNGSDKSSEADHGIRSLEESMVNRLGFLPEEDGELEQTSDGKTLYIVFSTDCGSFQHWQSYLLFFSAVRIRQPGFITRIASGCTEEEKQEAKEWYQTHIQGKGFIIEIYI